MILNMFSIFTDYTVTGISRLAIFGTQVGSLHRLACDMDFLSKSIPATIEI
jgi:hypothetical protein